MGGYFSGWPGGWSVDLDLSDRSLQPGPSIPSHGRKSFYFFGMFLYIFFENLVEILLTFFDIFKEFFS